MCHQFDIYRNPSARSNALQPYLMVIQHDYYNDLSTRLIAPLSYQRALAGYYHPITPLIVIDFQKLFLFTPGITSVDKKRLSNQYFICNLRNERSRVIGAIDALVTNV